MMLQRSKIIDQFLAVAMLTAVGFAAYAVVVAPIAGRIQTARDRLIEQRGLLGRLHDELQLAAARDGAPLATVEGLRDSVFLTGTSNATRVANLQARLGALLTKANVAILTARAVAPETRDELPFLGVEINFRATDAQLLKLLSAVESDRPFLFIDGLQMSPAPEEADIGRTTSSQNDVTLRIVGVVEQKVE